MTPNTTKTRAQLESMVNALQEELSLVQQLLEEVPPEDLDEAWATARRLSHPRNLLQSPRTPRQEVIATLRALLIADPGTEHRCGACGYVETLIKNHDGHSRCSSCLTIQSVQVITPTKPDAAKPAGIYSEDSTSHGEYCLCNLCVVRRTPPDKPSDT